MTSSVEGDSLRKRFLGLICLLLVSIAFWTGILWTRVDQSLTPEQTLIAFFHAWATGDRQTAEALLLRPERLWRDFGKDVKSLRLVKIDLPLRAAERQEDYRNSRGFSQVIILRATFDVEFHRDGSMTSGRHVYSYFLVKKWPWSSWRVSDWTSQP